MPKWLDNAIFYEIYPQTFLDTNGDGIGDFQGIIRKLDYIKELGCNAIWLNPCFVSPFFSCPGRLCASLFLYFKHRFATFAAKIFYLIYYNRIRPISQ